MAFTELFDRNGDVGLLVVGEGVDKTFREEADEAHRPDERLLTVSVDTLLAHDALVLAAKGRHATIKPTHGGDIPLLS